MKLIIFFLLLSSIFWGVEPQNKMYIPISQGTNLSESPKAIDNLYIQKVAARRVGHLRVGNQEDINEFNEDSDGIFIPKPFRNKTNSYWLDPNFQMGPGSVNDFGGNPSAEQMLGPYIF
ncbi:MAG: hypothetical protein ACRC0X_06515 [Brevinema sp.]